MAFLLFLIQEGEAYVGWEYRDMGYHPSLHEKLYVLWLFGITVWFVVYVTKMWWAIGYGTEWVRTVLDGIEASLTDGTQTDTEDASAAIPKRYPESALHELGEGGATLDVANAAPRFQIASDCFDLNCDEISARLSRIATAAGLLIATTVVYALYNASQAFYEIGSAKATGLGAITGWLAVYLSTLSVSAGIVSVMYFARRHFEGRLRRRRLNWKRFMLNVGKTLNR